MSDKLMGVKIPENKALIAFLVLVSIGAVYVFGSFAIDSGSYWHYLGMLVFLVILIKLIGVFIRTGKSGKKR